MKRGIVAALIAAAFIGSACASKQPSPDSLYLDALGRDGIKLTFAGEASESSTINYGKGICDLVRRKGASYDPLPVVVIDHKLSEEKARVVVTAAMESYCPALIR